MATTKKRTQAKQADPAGQLDTQGKASVKAVEKRAQQIGREQLPTRPGIEQNMDTSPIYDDSFPGAQRLKEKIALMTGADSGIGRAVALAYAKEGAKVAILYLKETQDAKETLRLIEELGGDAMAIAGDVGDPAFCKRAVNRVVKQLGGLDILVNNAAEQHPQKSILDITPKQLEATFRTNIFGMFYMTQAALKHMKKGSCIINTGSVTAYEGNQQLIDYAATKGAIATFTRSLAQNLADKGIRVNQVAPGPIWTPLIPSTFEPGHVDTFGENTLMQRPGQPLELAEAYVFLAWERASSYITGQTIHINGGRFVTN